MSRSVELVTPIPSAETVANRLGMSDARRKLIFDLADGLDIPSTGRSKPSGKGNTSARHAKKTPIGLRAKPGR